MSVGAALLALEAGFRAIPQAIPRGACKNSLTLAHAYCQHHYQYDDPLRLGYVFTPGYSYDGPWNPADPTVIDAEAETCAPFPDHTFHYTFQADHNGFVGNDTPWHDHYDIVVTGDSFTRAYAPVWWLDFVRVKTGLTALNLGMDGWGTLAEVEAVAQYGLAKSPRWVILLWFEGNDLFEVGEYQRRRDSGLDWRAYQLSLTSPLNRAVMPHVLRYWIDEAGRLIGVVPESITCRYPMTVTTCVGRFQTIFFNTHIAQLSFSREDLVAMPEWALASGALLDLRAAVEAQGGRFLLVYVPAKEHLYFSHLWEQKDINHFLELTVPLRSYAEFCDVVDDQMALVEDFAAAHEIEFLNLTGEFWRRTMEGGEEYYNYADLHWNAAGNELAAELIAGYIVAADAETHAAH